MFRVAVCEDCSQQTEIILTLLDKYKTDRPGIAVKPNTFFSGKELLDVLNTGAVFDLFLLDILMPGLNGIELAQEIRARNANAPIIFLTSSTDYALDAFRVSAVQYILKPVVCDKLFPALDRIVTALKYENERSFLFTMPKHVMNILFSSIVCVELAGRSLRLYHENGEDFLSSSIRTTFAVAVSPLFEDDRFFSPHKSFVVNMVHVEELEANFFIMKNRLEVPVPRYKYAEAKARYHAHFLNK